MAQVRTLTEWGAMDPTKVEGRSPIAFRSTMAQRDTLLIKELAALKKLVNHDPRPYDTNMMVMPGTLEDKHTP